VLTRELGASACWRLGFGGVDLLEKVAVAVEERAVHVGLAGDS
jgi:hypothetical protein